MIRKWYEIYYENDTYMVRIWYKSVANMLWNLMRNYENKPKMVWKWFKNNTKLVHKFLNQLQDPFKIVRISFQIRKEIVVNRYSIIANRIVHQCLKSIQNNHNMIPNSLWNNCNHFNLWFVDVIQILHSNVGTCILYISNY